MFVLWDRHTKRTTLAVLTAQGSRTTGFPLGWGGFILYPRVSIQDQDLGLGAFLKDSGDQDDDGRNSQAIQAIQDNLSLESICSDLQEYVLHKN